MEQKKNPNREPQPRICHSESTMMVGSLKISSNWFMINHDSFLIIKIFKKERPNQKKIVGTEEDVEQNQAQ